MFGIIKLTIHTITGMWVSIVLFKLMTNGWSGFYFQCCVLSLVFLTVSWLLSGEWLAGKSKAEPSRSTLLSFTLKWSTKTGHRVRVFSSIDFPIRLVVTHHYIRAVLVRCNIQRY
ncbi:hypothetical protein PQ647_12380, partial [Escherichia coli]